jgi:hypothetical protein
MSAFQSNNFKRTLQRTGRADEFTVGAPAAIINLEYSHGIITEHKGAAFAYSNAKTASIAPGMVYNGHYGQTVFLLRK